MRRGVCRREALRASRHAFGITSKPNCVSQNLQSLINRCLDVEHSSIRDKPRTSLKILSLLLLCIWPISTVCQQPNFLGGSNAGPWSQKTNFGNASLDMSLRDFTSSTATLLDFVSDPDFEVAMRRGATPHSCNGEGDRYCGNAHLATRCPDVCAQRICQTRSHHNLFNLIIDEGRYDYVYVWDREVCVTSCREEPWRGVCAPGAGLWVNGDFYCTALDCSYTIEPAVSGCHQERDFFRPNCAACSRLFPSACQYNWPPKSQPSASSKPSASRADPPSPQNGAQQGSQSSSESSSQASASITQIQHQVPPVVPLQQPPAPDFSGLPQNNRPVLSSESEDVPAPEVENLPPLNTALMPESGAIPGIPQNDDQLIKDPVTIKDLVFALPPEEIPPEDETDFIMDFVPSMAREPTSTSQNVTPVHFNFLLEPTTSHDDAGARLILRSTIAELSGLAHWQVKDLAWQPIQLAELRATASTTEGPRQEVSGVFQGSSALLAGRRLQRAGADGSLAKSLEMVGLVYVPGSLSVQANDQELEPLDIMNQIPASSAASEGTREDLHGDMQSISNDTAPSFQSHAEQVSKTSEDKQKMSPVFIALICILVGIVLLSIMVMGGILMWFMKSRRGAKDDKCNILATCNQLYSATNDQRLIATEAKEYHVSGNNARKGVFPQTPTLPKPPPPSPAEHLMQSPKRSHGLAFYALDNDSSQLRDTACSSSSGEHLESKRTCSSDSLTIAPSDVSINPEDIQMKTVSASLDLDGYTAPILPQRNPSSQQRWIDVAPNLLATMNGKY